MNLDQNVLSPGGPQAAQIADLYWFYAAVMALVCLLVWSFVLVALIRRRDTQQPPAVDQTTFNPSSLSPLQTLSARGERRRLGWVSGATALTAVTLVVLLIESVRVSDGLNALSNDRALHIELTGHRWWWGARYHDDNGHSGVFETANELHIPVGRLVELTLASADVIHSFWVPNLHGKRDLIPGRRSKLLLRADKPGRYRGQCAEFCGTSHAEMALWVIAEPEADFRAWRARQLETAPEPVALEAKRGRDVFMSGPCALCHAISGTPAQSVQGPDLTHVASRTTLAAGTLSNTRGHLAGWLVNAPNIKPGTQMPSITLPAADLHALIAYLETLR